MTRHWLAQVAQIDGAVDVMTHRVGDTAFSVGVGLFPESPSDST